MSTLETNSIAKYSGNNVSIDDALNLKSYTTTQRDALTSAAGDIIYNSTTNKTQFYNGSAWADTGVSFIDMEYLVIAGGGAGGHSSSSAKQGGGGGAGGYRSNVSGENTGGNVSTTNAFTTYFIQKGTSYTVTVGGGGSSNATGGIAGQGSDSRFGKIISSGGGAGGHGTAEYSGQTGGSGGGGSTANKGKGIAHQGFAGGEYGAIGGGNTNNAGGGGGGASSVGADGASANGGNGGAGLASEITGSSVTRGGGGGGGTGENSSGGAGTASGGGGAGGYRANGTAGTANTGGGGGGGGSYNTARDGAAGGSGTVILRWVTADATIGGTRTGLTDGGVQTDGSDSYIVFTAGTGTVSFS
tara:strand:- start:5513 stop:6586 length:1074 start_codon:yes stop_codon:yes gene_type:complete